MKLWGICSWLILINYFQTVISPFGDKAPIGGELDSNNCWWTSSALKCLPGPILENKVRTYRFNRFILGSP